MSTRKHSIGIVGDEVRVKRKKVHSDEQTVDAYIDNDGPSRPATHRLYDHVRDFSLPLEKFSYPNSTCLIIQLAISSNARYVGHVDATPMYPNKPNCIHWIRSSAYDSESTITGWMRIDKTQTIRIQAHMTPNRSQRCAVKLLQNHKVYSDELKAYVHTTLSTYPSRWIRKEAFTQVAAHGPIPCLSSSFREIVDVSFSVIREEVTRRQNIDTAFLSCGNLKNVCLACKLVTQMCSLCQRFVGPDMHHPLKITEGELFDEKTIQPEEYLSCCTDCLLYFDLFDNDQEVRFRLLALNIPYGMPGFTQWFRVITQLGFILHSKDVLFPNELSSLVSSYVTLL